MIQQIAQEKVEQALTCMNRLLRRCHVRHS
jgi:hypothetical protein